MKFIILLLTLICFFSASAKSQNASNYKQCNSHKFTYYLLKVYDISLCYNQEDPLNSKNLYSQNFALIIKYSINIKGKKFVETSMEEIARYYKLDDETQKNYQDQLLNIFVDVKPKDEIAAVYNASGTIDFYYNQKEIGKITDKNFSKIFLNIWLHPKAHYQDMRNDLIK